MQLQMSYYIVFVNLIDCDKEPDMMTLPNMVVKINKWLHLCSLGTDC